MKRIFVFILAVFLLFPISVSATESTSVFENEPAEEVQQADEEEKTEE